MSSSLSPTYDSVAEAIAESTGSAFAISRRTALGGGCINQAFKIESSDGREFFVKENDLSFLPYFSAEAQALEEIHQTQTIRVPRVVSSGKTSSNSFLVLEYLREGSSHKAGQRELGRKLAELHAIEQAFWGWHLDNCIGATPQPNPKTGNWVDFYRESRLLHQFKLAERRGAIFAKANLLLDHLDFFFEGYAPKPSLLHGDLWGGNASFDANGDPFVFDPASYYGDREADLAFTYMFGGFSTPFYEAYEECHPLHPGFKTRKILYNLYHELNHYNLFGGGYANSAQESMSKLANLLP